MSGKRRGWVAIVLSLAAIGTGHLYSGAWRRAVILILSGFGLPFLAVALLPTGFAGFVAMLVLMLTWIALELWAAVDANRQAKARPANQPLPLYGRWYIVVAAVLLSWYATDALRSWLREGSAQAFRIPSGAMMPTLQIGDFLMVDKTAQARQVDRGALYVFRSVDEPTIQVLKRATAVGGDTVAMRAGQLLVNERAVEEPYVTTPNANRQATDSVRLRMRLWQLGYLVGRDPAGYSPDLNEWGPLLVPSGSFLALGDNREASYDSRHYGFVPDSLVRGRPKFIYFSRDTLGTIRWPRFGLEPR